VSERQLRLTRPNRPAPDTEHLTERQRELLRYVRAAGVVTEPQVARDCRYLWPAAALRRLKLRGLVARQLDYRGRVVPRQWRAIRNGERPA
jgi:hypothetical protein